MDNLNLYEMVGSVLLKGEVEETLHVLCDRLGMRWPGTEGEAAAADYIVSKFNDYGLENVMKEPFALSTWDRGDAILEMMSPFSRPLTILALPNTGTHSVEGDGQFVGFETLDEWNEIAPMVAGRIVICQGGSRKGVGPRLSRGDKARLVLQAGAIGFLWVAEREGKVALTGSIDRSVGEAMPCATIVREDAALLRRAQEKYGRVRLSFRTHGTRRTIEAYNVVGEIPGTDRADSLVLAGAHYDGHDISDAAHDNASGVAAMLEAARVLARYRGKLRSTVRFVMCTAEEMGVVGSAVYAREHEDEHDRVRFMLNADGVGRSPDNHYLHLPLGGAAVPWLQNLMKQYGRSVDVEKSSMPLYWDHEAFALAGVPCGSITDPAGIGGWGHTVADSLDKLSMENVKRAAIHIGLVLASVANADDWPGRRVAPAEVKEVLVAAGLSDEAVATRAKAVEELIAGAEVQRNQPS